MNHKLSILLGLSVLTTIALAEPKRETFAIVQTGEGVPEALMRVTKVRTLAAGKVEITVAGGPCRRDSKNIIVYNVVSTESITQGDLFYQVSTNTPAGGFALRRATSTEREKYEKCRWR